MRMNTYLYIVSTPSGSIIQGEITGKDQVHASQRLVNKITVPYTLQAMKDITLDKAIEECGRRLRGVRRG